MPQLLEQPNKQSALQGVMSAVLKVSPQLAEELLMHFEAEKLLLPFTPKLRKASERLLGKEMAGAGVELCPAGQFGEGERPAGRRCGH